MRLLLDTHTLLWWSGKSRLLSAKARDLLEDTTSEVFVSVANAWEMQIKAQVGKLTLHKPWSKIIRGQMETNGFRLLQVELPHIEVLDQLPFHHKDPFDRLLLAQALHEGMTLVSNDSKLAQYPVSLIW